MLYDSRFFFVNESTDGSINKISKSEIAAERRVIRITFVVLSISLFRYESIENNTAAAIRTIEITAGYFEENSYIYEKINK